MPPDPTENIIGERVEKLRKAVGFETQESLAKAAGLDRTVIAKVENGHNKLTTYGLRKQIADALGVPLEIFGDYLDHELPLESVVLAAKRKTNESGEVRIGLTDVSPARAAAVAFARANGLSEAAIQKVETMPVQMLTPEEWYTRIKTAEIDLRANGPDTPAAATRISHR